MDPRALAQRSRPATRLQDADERDGIRGEAFSSHQFKAAERIIEHVLLRRMTCDESIPNGHSAERKLFHDIAGVCQRSTSEIEGDQGGRKVRALLDEVGAANPSLDDV
jgi:hypothetical protein